MLHFKETEFKKRENALKLQMQKEELDIFLIFSPESQYWLTGFDTFGYCFFQCLVVSNKKNVLLTRSADFLQAKFTSNVSDIRIWKDEVNATPWKNLLDIINEVRSKRNSVGIEMDTHGLTAFNFNKLKETLSFPLRDSSDIISKLRLIKSEDELKYVRKAGEIADKCLVKIKPLIKEGIQENEILAVMQGENFKLGGDYPANEFIVGSGRNALLCRYQAEKRILSKQDQITLEWAGVYKHYHAAMMRTAIIGKVSNKQLQMHKITVQALKECEKILKPNKSMSQVFNTYKNVMKNFGFEHAKLNACGYALGARFSPSWMEREMFYENSNTIIKKNMVFFLHMIMMDEKENLAMCLGRSYIVTNTNPESLSKVDIDLIN